MFASGLPGPESCSSGQSARVHRPTLNQLFCQRIWHRKFKVCLKNGVYTVWIHICEGFFWLCDTSVPVYPIGSYWYIQFRVYKMYSLEYLVVNDPRSSWNGGWVQPLVTFTWTKHCPHLKIPLKSPGWTNPLTIRGMNHQVAICVNQHLGSCRSCLHKKKTHLKIFLHHAHGDHFSCPAVRWDVI